MRFASYTSARVALTNAINSAQDGLEAAIIDRYAFDQANPEPTPLYYNAVVDASWATLGNWWEDSLCTIQAASLPETGESVVIRGNISTVSPAPLMLNNVRVEGGMWTVDFTGITANLFEVFDGCILVNVLDGTAVFNDTSESQCWSVTGLATFKDNSKCSGTVGNALFRDNAICSGATGGNVDVHSPAPYPLGGTHGGSVSYHDYPMGCTNPSATNYDPGAIIDDGSCVLI